MAGRRGHVLSCLASGRRRRSYATAHLAVGDYCNVGKQSWLAKSNDTAAQTIKE